MGGTFAPNPREQTRNCVSHKNVSLEQKNMLMTQEEILKIKRYSHQILLFFHVSFQSLFKHFHNFMGMIMK